MTTFFFLALFSLGVTAKQSIFPNTDIHDYVRSHGIALEDHVVTTDDGYISTMFRMPRPGAPVVILQHGILASAWCWLVQENVYNAPAFALYNLGYDVWLPNNRGNIFGRNHTTLRPSSKAFWDITFDEMGRYDVPANINMALRVSGQVSLSFVGWSQGTTQMLIAGSTYDSSLASKVNLFVGLSPVSFLKHSTSILLTPVSELRIAAAVMDVYPYGFVKGSPALSDLEELVCKATLGLVCQLSIDAVCGVSSLDSETSLENMVAHFPAGAPVKDMVHFEQLIDNNRFGKFNYGNTFKPTNKDMYNQTTPPDYDLASFNIPTALFRGSQDDLVAKKDVEKLISLLPPSTLVFNKVYQGYSHVTWFVGTNSDYLFDLEKLLAQFSSSVSNSIS